jgi:multiple sugar transport system substrate-binding protein
MKLKMGRIQMKNYSKIFIFALLSIMLILSGCSKAATPTASIQPTDAAQTAEATPAAEAVTEATAAPTEAPKDENAYVPNKDIKGEITVWSFVEKASKAVAVEFNKEFPNIKVNTVILDFGGLHDKLQTTLAAGKGAPDVAVVEQGQFPRYMTGNVLEDLLQPPYDAGKYKKDVSEYNWTRWMSVDGTKLLGMPWDVTPEVYYYRADIFEELGLPSEPEELGDYMQDPENFMNIIQKLKASGKYAFEWKDGPIHWAGDEIGYFDKDMNWLRTADNEKLIQMLDITKRGAQLGWAPHIGGLFDEKGKQMVKKGQLVGMALGSWGARELEKSFPEQKGKWRATKLPLDINFGGGGSTFLMPAQSKNKEAAWAYIEWSMRSENAWKVWTQESIQPGWSNIASLPWYSEHKSEFLGGQEDYKFYEQLVDKIPVKRLTPLDGDGWNIWLEGVLKAIDKNVDSKTTIQQIQDNAKAKLAAKIAKFQKDTK